MQATFLLIRRIARFIPGTCWPLRAKNGENINAAPDLAPIGHEIQLADRKPLN